MAEQQDGVRFIRKNGRIIPIRSKEVSAAEKKGLPAVTLAFRKKNVSLGQRASAGFQVGGSLGGLFGAALGLDTALSKPGGSFKAAAAMTALGGIGGTVIGGISGGVVNGAFGARKRTEVSIVGVGRYVKGSKNR